MSGKEIFELSDKPIVCFSFNGDRSRIAFSYEHDCVIKKKDAAGKWVEEAVLSEHHQNVTGIDWAPNSNRIVTCGADRNGYVWVEENGKWRPTLVILRINRAATYVRWSPLEDKFAVASGARLISICYFEQENHWWVSKHIKKPIRSTVLSLDWHPNNVLVAASSSDFKARVFSAYIKEIESKPEATNWGKKMPFGAIMAEFVNSSGGGGWIHDVVFSPSGAKIAWVSHDSSISVVEGGEEKPVTLNFNGLPLKSLVWLNEGTLVAGGHEFVPMVFSHDGNNKLSMLAKLDAPGKKTDDDETMSAMERFRSLDKKASGSKEAKSSTTHTNAIMQISVYSGSKENVEKISTAGLDGRVVLWDIKTLESSIAGLKI